MQMINNRNISLISDCYEITETSEAVYIGSDFPSEYTGSKSRIELKGARRKTAYFSE